MFFWTRRMQFQQPDREFFARILWKNKAQLFRRKPFYFLKKFLRTCLTQFCQPWWSFSAKKSKNFGTNSENESEYMSFFQKMRFDSKYFSAHPNIQNSFTPLPTFFCGESETLLHIVQKGVWSYFFEKNYSSSQSKTDSEFINFKERVICFKKLCHTCKHRLQIPQCCRNFFAESLNTFRPQSRNWYKFMKSEKKLFSRQKKLPDLKKTVSITLPKTFRKKSEFFAQGPKTAMQYVSRKQLSRRKFRPDK